MVRIELKCINPITEDLGKILEIVANTDNEETVRVCNMYTKLCETLAEGLVPDSTARIMEHLLAKSMSTGMCDPDENGWIEPHDVRPANDPIEVDDGKNN